MRKMRNDEEGYARRKRMTDAITPALKPTPLEGAKWSDKHAT